MQERLDTRDVPGLYDVPVSKGAPSRRRRSVNGMPQGSSNVNTEESNVIVYVFICKAGLMLDAAKGGYAGEDRVCLGATVAGQSIVPQALVRPLDGHLVVIFMGECNVQQSTEGKKQPHIGWQTLLR